MGAVTPFYQKIPNHISSSYPLRKDVFLGITRLVKQANFNMRGILRIKSHPQSTQYQPSQDFKFNARDEQILREIILEGINQKTGEFSAKHKTIARKCGLSENSRDIIRKSIKKWCAIGVLCYSRNRKKINTNNRHGSCQREVWSCNRYRLQPNLLQRIKIALKQKLSYIHPDLIAFKQGIPFKLNKINNKTAPNARECTNTINPTLKQYDPPDKVIPPPETPLNSVKPNSQPTSLDASFKALWDAMQKKKGDLQKS